LLGGSTVKPPRDLEERIPSKVLDAIEKLLELLEASGVKVEEAFLFGSYARGDWLKYSDVDLVIVSSSFRGLRYIDRLDLVYRLEWRPGITPWIEVIPLTPEELRSRMESSAVLRDASRYWVRVK